MKILKSIIASVLSAAFISAMTISALAEKDVTVFEGFGKDISGTPASFLEIGGGSDHDIEENDIKGNVFKVKGTSVGVFPLTEENLINEDCKNLHVSMDVKLCDVNSVIYPTIFSAADGKGIGSFNSNPQDRGQTHLIELNGNGNVEAYDGNGASFWTPSRTAVKMFDGYTEWVKADFFWNVEDNVLEGYVNGDKVVILEKINRTYLKFPIKGFGFYTNKSAGFNMYDNIYVNTYEESDILRFNIDTKGTESIGNDDSIYIGFSEYLTTVPEESSFVIKNAMTGEEFSDYTVTGDNLGVRIDFSGIPDGKYVVGIKDLNGIKSVSTSEITETFFVSSTGAPVLDKVEFFDYDGNVLDYSKDVTTGLTEITISFSADIDETEIEKYIYIKDEEQPLADVEYLVSGKEVHITLKKLLTSGKKYTLNILNTSQPSAIDFTMAEDSTYGFFGQSLTENDGVASFKVSVVKTDSLSHKATIILIGLSDDDGKRKLEAFDIKACDFDEDSKQILNLELNIDSLENIDIIRGIICTEPELVPIFAEEYKLTK